MPALSILRKDYYLFCDKSLIFTRFWPLLGVYNRQIGGARTVNFLTSTGTRMTQKLIGGVVATVGLLLLVVQAQGKSSFHPAMHHQPVLAAWSNTWSLWCVQCRHDDHSRLPTTQVTSFHGSDLCCSLNHTFIPCRGYSEGENSNDHLYPHTGLQVCPSLSCPKPSGFFAHPTNCGSYVKCSHGEAYTKECPEGLHFHPLLRRCDYPELAQVRWHRFTTQYEIDTSLL